MLMSSSLKVDNDGVRPGVGLHLVQAAGEGTSPSELSEHPSSSPPGPQLGSVRLWVGQFTQGTTLTSS